MIDFADPPKQSAVVAGPQVVLPHAAVFLQEQPRRPHLHERETPAGRVRRTAILLPQRPQLLRAQAAGVGRVIPGEHGVEASSVEVSVHVVDACVGAVLGLVDARDVDPIPWVRDIGVRDGRGVREEEWNQKTTDAEDDAESEGPEAVVYVHGVNDAVIVAVPE